MQRYATNIKWDVEDKSDYDTFNLPSKVKIPKNIEDDDIADHLSDKYGFCVESFKIKDIV